MSGRIGVRATQVGDIRSLGYDPARHPGYAPRRRGLWERLKAVVPTPTNLRRYRARVARERVFDRMLAKSPRKFTAEENRRMRAEYEADYESWLAAQGFPTNLKHAKALDESPDLQPPVGE